jgi:hypothetical protein
MKLKLSPMHAIVFIGAFVPTTMLILGLTAPIPNSHGNVHSQPLHRAMEPPHRSPLMHDLISSAISVANRL